MIRSRLSALEAHDPTYLWKFIVRALAALLSLTGVALAGHALAASLHDPNDNSMVPRQYSSYKHWRHYYDLNLYLPWLFIPLSLSILWNGTNIAAYVVRTKSLQPVANFISDLLLGLGLLATGIYAAFPAARFIHFTLEEYGRVFGRTWSIPRNRSSTYNQTNPGPLGVEFLTPSNVTGQVCAGLLVDDCTATLQLVKGYNIKGRVIMAGCVTAYIVFLLHLALFVSACRHIRDRKRFANANSIEAKAMEAKAETIARKIITELTGPGGGYVRINQEREALQEDE